MGEQEPSMMYVSSLLLTWVFSKNRQSHRKLTMEFTKPCGGFYSIERKVKVTMYLTLDEAIDHAEEVANEQKKKACNLYDAKNYEASRECIWCAEEHSQLAEWLKDYKQLLEKEPILDKIRAEINGLYRVILKDTPKDDWAVRWNDCIDEVLQIIDKHKGESEEV